MGNQKRDHRAEFGRKPTWDLQRQKQESMAEGFYDDYQSDMEIQEEEA